MTRTIQGKIHGKTIELDEDLGVAEDQEVEVQVRIVQPARKWGEGILRTAGGLPTTPNGTRSWSRSIEDANGACHDQGIAWNCPRQNYRGHRRSGHVGRSSRGTDCHGFARTRSTR